MLKVMTILYKQLLPPTVLGLVLILAASGQSMAITLSTPSGYSTEVLVQSAEDAEHPVGIVYIHGKRANPFIMHNKKFIDKMSQSGFKVVAPVMPWSQRRGYEGSREQGLEVIQAAVELFGERPVVVIGHSLGGMSVLQFAAGETGDNVVGVVAVAPGHDPHRAGKLRRATAVGADRACRAVAEGRGSERFSFPDMNGIISYRIDATATFYCTYYSVDHYPDSQQVVRKIGIPVLILAGQSDRLTQIYQMEKMFRLLPPNSKHQYLKRRGKHLNVLFLHTDDIARWIDSL